MTYGISSSVRTFGRPDGGAPTVRARRSQLDTQRTLTSRSVVSMRDVPLSGPGRLLNFIGRLTCDFVEITP